MENKKSFARRRLYLLLVTLVGLIGSLVCIGGVIHQVLQHVVISEDEYLAGRYGYTAEQCEQWLYSVKTETYKELTEEEISICKEERIAEAIISRSVDYKEGLIWFLSRGLLFVILLVTHLPVFLKSTKKE